MTILNDIVGQIPKFLAHDNDDAVDRLHYRYTVIGLAVYLVMLTTKQYYGEPIVCVPANSATTDQKNYINSMCWLTDNYKFNGNRTEPPYQTVFDSSTRISYYQWITLVIIAQCFLFTIPSLLWSFIISLSGFDLVYVTQNVVRKNYLAYYANETNWPKIQKTLQNLTDHLRISLIKPSKIKDINQNGDENDETYNNYIEEKAKQPRKRFLSLRLPFSSLQVKEHRRKNPKIKSKSTFLLYFPYMGIKLAYLINLVLQFLFLSWVFNFNYLEYGVSETFRVLLGVDYKFDNIYFPKRSMCNIKLLSMARFQENTVLCSLPLNLFNEIFYSAFWAWSIVLAFFTVSSFAYWSALLNKNYRRNYVLRTMDLNLNETALNEYFGHAGINSSSMDEESKLIKQFTCMTPQENFNLFFDHVCSLDVILTIKLLSINTNKLVAKDILNTLWYEYLGITDKVAQSERRPIPDFLKPDYKFNQLKENEDEDVNSLKHNKENELDDNKKA